MRLCLLTNSDVMPNAMPCIFVLHCFNRIIMVMMMIAILIIIKIPIIFIIIINIVTFKKNVEQLFI